MNEDLKTFDCRRSDFEPYGLTCEKWITKVMPRFDRHNEIELNFFPKSSATYLMSERLIKVPPHRLVIFWGLIPHKILRVDSEGEYCVCTIPLSRFFEWKLPEPFQSKLMKGLVLAAGNVDDGGFDEMMMRRWHEDLSRSTPMPLHQEEAIKDIILLEMRARLLRLSYSFLTLEGQDDEAGRCSGQKKLFSNEGDIAPQLAIYIAKNYMVDIGVADVARSVGLHPDYANSLFRKAFGCTIYNFIVQERLSHVERLLITTDLPITDIAFSCGFNTISNFNSTFLRKNGCTPREYRKRLSLI